MGAAHFEVGNAMCNRLVEFLVYFILELEMKVESIIASFGRRSDMLQDISRTTLWAQMKCESGVKDTYKLATTI
jgi:hypothetical protein